MKPKIFVFILSQIFFVLGIYFIIQNLIIHEVILSIGVMICAIVFLFLAIAYFVLDKKEKDCVKSRNQEQEKEQ